MSVWAWMCSNIIGSDGIFFGPLVSFFLIKVAYQWINDLCLLMNEWMPVLGQVDLSLSLHLSLSPDTAESSGRVSVPPEADAGWRVHVGVVWGWDPWALVLSVSVRLRVSAAAVLPDEWAVLVELDVHAVSVFPQTVVTLALQLGTQRALAVWTLLVVVAAK